MSVTENFPGENGVYPCNDGYSLYLRTNIYGDYSLAALVSDNAFTDQLNTAFRTTYLLLLIVGLFGLLLIFISMRMTYFPLSRLIKKITVQEDHARDYFELLEESFTSIISEKEELSEKISKYHQSIQQSQLESGLHNDMSSSFKHIEQVFRTDCPNCLYVLRIHYAKPAQSAEKVQQFLEDRLPANSSAILLETTADDHVYVVNCLTPQSDADKTLDALMTVMHRRFGCYLAVSNSTSSMTDIPTLYENMLLASHLWPETPVAVYSETSILQPNTGHSLYPYKLLDKLNDSLKRLDFQDSQELLEQMFTQIDQLMTSKSRYPDFIIRSLLIDILMSLFSSMNQHDIKFKLYSDLYFETLYYCRSCNWQEKEQEISHNLKQLLELFQTEQHTIRSNQILKYLEENYTSEELTITTLADHFHVSNDYMSYLFKKEFGENFVDYLWKLRFRKAADLLLNTDMPIDTISVLVGYVNPSSFRRKFKQETGLTPSQFRSQ